MSNVVVLDTNVAVAANEKSEQASPDCVSACQTAVLDVVEHRRRLALDAGGQIIEEYQRALRPAGQPGIGHQFLKWVLTNRANVQLCDLVPLTALPEDPSDFAEFPSAGDLRTFDRADRKFVAVANAHAQKPPILQGLDSKWWGLKDALASADIRVQFLCVAEVEATYERKFGRKPPPRRPRRV